MLDIARLEHFAALARSDSYTSAARDLHVSQATLTRSIQSLERTLRTRLLERGNSGIALTAAGDELLPLALDLIRRAGTIETEISTLGQGVRRTVRMGVGAAIGTVILGQVLETAAVAKPELVIQVHLADAQVLAGMLLRGELDFAISRDLNPGGWHDGLTTTVIARTQPAFFVHRGHPLAARGRVLFDDVRRYPKICFRGWNDGLPSWVRPELIPLLSSNIEIDEFWVASQVAEHVDGILISNIGLVRDELVRLEIADRGEALQSSPVTVSRPANRVHTSSVSYLMDLAVAAVRAAFAEADA